MNKTKNIKEEIDFILEREKYCKKLVNLIKTGDLPLRVIHNDAKLNNVLLDEKTNEPVAIIDLDTIMPGTICYDFGDSIRFGCNTGSEDESNLNKVNFNIKLFEEYTKGYLSVFGENITKCEKDNLPWGAVLMTFECGIRFLTDYLNGNIYFRTNRENQNLDRARTQFKLVSDMEKHLSKMQKIIDKY